MSAVLLPTTKSDGMINSRHRQNSMNAQMIIARRLNIVVIGKCLGCLEDSACRILCRYRLKMHQHWSRCVQQHRYGCCEMFHEDHLAQCALTVRGSYDCSSLDQVMWSWLCHLVVRWSWLVRLAAWSCSCWMNKVKLYVFIIGVEFLNYFTHSESSTA